MGKIRNLEWITAIIICFCFGVVISPFGIKKSGSNKKINIVVNQKDGDEGITKHRAKKKVTYLENEETTMSSEIIEEYSCIEKSGSNENFFDSIFKDKSSKPCKDWDF